tara:strand:+ start:378 stop:566 length:189 start_codon:yes stop_codon:yes gene_type:complete
MIWVLVLVFLETSHEALAKFDSAEECKAKMAELEEAYQAHENPDEYKISFFEYNCIPVPDKP